MGGEEVSARLGSGEGSVAEDVPLERRSEDVAEGTTDGVGAGDEDVADAVVQAAAKAGAGEREAAAAAPAKGPVEDSEGDDGSLSARPLDDEVGGDASPVAFADEMEAEAGREEVSAPGSDEAGAPGSLTPREARFEHPALGLIAPSPGGVDGMAQERFKDAGETNRAFDGNDAPMSDASAAFPVKERAEVVHAASSGASQEDAAPSTSPCPAELPAGHEVTPEAENAPKELEEARAMAEEARAMAEEARAMAEEARARVLDTALASGALRGGLAGAGSSTHLVARQVRTEQGRPRTSLRVRNERPLLRRACPIEHRNDGAIAAA